MVGDGGFVCRRSWAARAGFVLSALAVALILRLRESPLETQQRLRESTTAHSRTTPALEELQYVVEQRWRRPRQRKVSRGNYQPFYGLTVLMRMNDTKSNGWATRLYRQLRENPNVTDALALLPPESYHVTLKTLDSILPKKGDEPGHSMLSLVEALREAQRALDDLVGRAGAPPLSFVPRRSKRPGILELAAASAETEVVLRRAEDAVATALSGHANATLLLQSRQQWHLTVGYPMQGRRYNERMRRMQKEVFVELVEDRDRTNGPPVFHVDAPQVATCRSMERFLPLFQLNSVLHHPLTRSLVGNATQ